MLEQDQKYQAFEDLPGNNEDQGYEEDEVQTLHLFDYDPEEPFFCLPAWKKDQIVAALMGVFALAMIVGLCFLPSSESYAIQTLTVPAHFHTLELKASASLTPTGIQTYPARKARGTLTVYNGSIFTQQLPVNFLLTASNGVEVVTDDAVIIPAANEASNPPAFGTVTVSAYAMNPGTNGNIQAGAITQAYGSDVTIKNLTAFSGGQDASTKTVVTAQDQTIALEAARAQLTAKQPRGLQNHSCAEKTSQQSLSVVVTWFCQYVTYQPPKGVQVLSMRLSGASVILTVKRGARSATTHFVK